MRLQAADTAPIVVSNCGAVGRTKVLHIVSGLAVGGAERSLLRLCQSLGQVDCEVASLSDSMALADEFPRAVWRCNLRQAPWRAARELAGLIKRAKDFAPDVVQGWMYHGNLVASLVARRLNVPMQVGRRPPIVWSIRHSVDSLRSETPRLRGLIRLGASRLCAPLLAPERVVYNSHRGWHTHAQLGYGRNASIVAPNGVDCERFTPPTPSQRAQARDQFGLADQVFALGCVARFHPQKGIADLLDAMAQLTPRDSASRPRTLLLAGAGMTADNTELRQLIEAKNLTASARPMGVVDDVRTLYWALDGLVLPSRFGEGTPNALLEAQACGLGVVATDVGDAARLIQKPRFIAPPADSAGLSFAIASLLGLTDQQRRELGATNSAHVHKHYSHDDCVARYAELYEHLLGARGNP